MSQSNALGRLLALRLLEEERAEARLRTERALQQTCADALQSFEQQARLASWRLHEALDAGDRTIAITAEMELAFTPLRGAALRKRMTQLNSRVDVATVAWRESRTHRLQIESVVASVKEHRQKEIVVREQKTMDGWFLMRKNSYRAPASGAKDESFQREHRSLLDDDGMPLAQ